MRTVQITIDTEMEKHIISKPNSVFNTARLKIHMIQFVKKVDELLKEYGSAAGAAMRH